MIVNIRHLVLFALFSLTGLQAAAIVGVTNQAGSLSSAAVATERIQAVGFNLPNPLSDLSISAWLTPYGTPAPVIGYLTNQIGPGTTTANLIGVSAVVPNTICQGRNATCFDGYAPYTFFSNLALPSGNYYLTLLGTRPEFTSGEADWAGGATTFSTPAATLLDGLLTAGSYNGALNMTFAPASIFIDGTFPAGYDGAAYPLNGLVFSVDTPEPATFALLGLGLLVAAAKTYQQGRRSRLFVKQESPVAGGLLPTGNPQA